MIRASLLVIASLYATAGGAVERVITLAPHLSELVCMAGSCDKLVGVDNFTDFPSQAGKLPKVGDAFAVNAEAIIGLKPDLVLSWDGGTPAETVERLTALGLRVEPISIHSLADVATALEHVGGLLGTADSAHAAAEAFRKRLNALSERYRNAKPLRVMYQIEADPAFTVNRQSPISEAISLCGGNNVFAGMKQLAAPVSKEAVLAANPEVVIYGQQDMAQEVRRYWAAFPQSVAQKRGNLYAVDASLLARPSPRMLDGVEQLCAALQTARTR
jgi:iron complex transport system substrate-binding protein